MWVESNLDSVRKMLSNLAGWRTNFDNILVFCFGRTKLYLPIHYNLSVSVMTYE